MPLLVQGTDFKCVDRAGTPLTFCFGIGDSNHVALQLFQRGLNRFSGMLGTEPLIVDGFIGPTTLAAAQRATTLLGQVPPNKEQLTAQARTFTAQLEQLATQQEALDSSQLSPPGQPVDPVTAVATTGIPQTTADEIVATTKAPAPSTAKKFLPWILAGLAAVLVVGGAGFFYYRRKVRLNPAWGDDNDRSKGRRKRWR